MFSWWFCCLLSASCQVISILNLFFSVSALSLFLSVCLSLSLSGWFFCGVFFFKLVFLPTQRPFFEMAQFLYICKTGFSFDFLEQNRTENRTQPEPESELEQCMERKQGREAAAAAKADSKTYWNFSSKQKFQQRIFTHSSSCVSFSFGVSPFSTLLAVCLSVSVCLSLSLSLSPAPALSRALPVEKGNTRTTVGNALARSMIPSIERCHWGWGDHFLGVVAAAAAATPNDKVYPLWPCGPFLLCVWVLLLAPSPVFLCATGLTSFRGCSVGSCGTVWRVLRTTLPFFLFLFSSIYLNTRFICVALKLSAFESLI